MLCSGTTPWDKLDEFEAGWSVEFDQSRSFVQKIEELIEYPVEKYNNLILGCGNYLKQIEDSNNILNNKMLFEGVKPQMKKEYLKCNKSKNRIFEIQFSDK